MLVYPQLKQRDMQLSMGDKEGFHAPVSDLNYLLWPALHHFRKKKLINHVLSWQNIIAWLLHVQDQRLCTLSSQMNLLWYFAPADGS